MSDMTIKGWGKILKFSKFYVQNIWQVVRRWHHQLTHLHIHTGLVKKCFLKNCETSKFHNFLIFQPIFIRFSLFCSENFTLSSEIKLDQLWTSPLKMRKNKTAPTRKILSPTLQHELDLLICHTPSFMKIYERYLSKQCM